MTCDTVQVTIQKCHSRFTFNDKNSAAEPTCSPPFKTEWYVMKQTQQVKQQKGFLTTIQIK